MELALAALFIPFSSLLAPLIGAQTVFAQQTTVAQGLNEFFFCRPEPSSETGDFKAPLDANGGSALSAPMEPEDNKRVFTIKCESKADPRLFATASVQVFVVLYKPVVELYSSHVGQPCMERRQKIAYILKGQPATLCWRVFPVETIDYEPPL